MKCAARLVGVGDLAVIVAVAIGVRARQQFSIAGSVADAAQVQLALGNEQHLLHVCHHGIRSNCEDDIVEVVVSTIPLGIR